jgi:dTDP-4-dehydrorhamnose reductase
MNATKRILITGASGMLGSTLYKQWQSKYQIYCTGTSKALPNMKNYMQFNLRASNFKELFDWAQPDVIVHCAALTNGNFCQENPEEAFLINGLSSYKLAQSASKNCRIIYISTDAVFSADLHMAKENDIPNPDNIYGKSKELGEFLLIQNSQNYTIVRTTIVGFNEKEGKASFVEWIIHSAKNKIPIQLFDDVLFNPISCSLLGNELSTIIDSGGFKNEIVHLSGSEVVSKFEFGTRLLSELNIQNETVAKGSILQFNQRAKRSTDQSLDCSYFQTATKRNLPNLEECIRSLSKEYYE